MKLPGGVVQLQPGSSASRGVLGSSREQIWGLGSKTGIKEKESLAFSELMDPRQKQSAGLNGGKLTRSHPFGWSGTCLVVVPLIQE